MPDLAAFRASLDGDVFTPDSPGYEAIRRPANVAYWDVRPRLVVRCCSVDDVAATVAYAHATGDHVAIRSGGHCFAGRSSTDGIVLDLSGLDSISVDDHIATIGAGARLKQVYAALHAHGRTLPAGCGPTVGIAGLTLGGGIGLLGRKYGLTCDRLLSAQVVLAGGTIVDCDADREPDLFWALRGAGGGQFGVVTELRFATVPEPVAVRIEAHVGEARVQDLAMAWQDWAPDAPDELTVNLTIDTEPLRATLFGASILGEAATRELLTELPVEVRAGLPYHQLKQTFEGIEQPGRRIRSEFFSRTMSGDTLAALLAETGGPRQLAFTAMGGAYNRVAEDATAFAHRNERFLLEHVGADPWVERSWAIAHADGSGRVYPNFPDLALDDAPAAYHAGNLRRLAELKAGYDPHRFFDFPQAI